MSYQRPLFANMANTVTVAGRVQFNGTDDTTVYNGEGYTVAQDGSTSGKFIVTITDSRGVGNILFAAATPFGAVDNVVSTCVPVDMSETAGTITFQCRREVITGSGPYVSTPGALGADVGTSVDIMFCIVFQARG